MSMTLPPVEAKTTQFHLSGARRETQIAADLCNEYQQTFTDKNHTYCMVGLSTKNAEREAIGSYGCPAGDD
jgi:hypothetical protein